MEVKINEEYRIKTDPYNYIVARRHVGKKGDVTWAAKSYHSTFGTALAAIFDKQLRDIPEQADMVALAVRIEDIRRELVRAVRFVKG